MALIKVEGLAEASGEVFSPIPAGMYKMRITQVQETVTGAKSKVPGSPMLKVQVKVAEDEAEAAGRILFMNIVLPTPQMELDKRTMSINRIKRLMLACGLEGNLDEFDTADLMGMEFKGVVTLKEENGQKQNNITDQLPLL